MRRREVILGLSILVVPCRADAQPTRRIYRIGLLRIGAPPPSFIGPFLGGLRDLGYVEGQNLVIEMGVAASAENLPEVARALVQQNVDVILASGAAAVLPA